MRSRTKLKSEFFHRPPTPDHFANNVREPYEDHLEKMPKIMHLVFATNCLDSFQIAKRLRCSTYITCNLDLLLRSKIVQCRQFLMTWMSNLSILLHGIHYYFGKKRNHSCLLIGEMSFDNNGFLISFSLVMDKLIRVVDDFLRSVSPS